MPRRSRKMRGGLFGIGEGTTGTNWWDSLTGKKSTGTTASMGFSMMGTDAQPSTGLGTQSSTGYGFGGKKYRKHHMKGGYTSNRAGGLATYAAPISDVKNAQPHSWVGGPEYKGGRTRKHRGRKHRHIKSCKHRKH